MSEEILVIEDQSLISLDVDATVDAWVNKTSHSNLARAKDIKNDKSRAIFNFFDFTEKSPERVLPQ
ncbi:MAG TPA: hypothetical protein PKY82_23775, partial [Pyrinomonadaceae bacterium]|nr:hypothetical protein [Pyrinomonadaceae bacterium]